MTDPLAAIAQGRRLLAAPAPGLARRRVAVLGAATLDYLTPHLAVAYADQGLALEAHQGAFGQWRQELLDPASAVYAFQPDAVLVVVDLPDFFPDWYEQPSRTESEQADMVARELEQLRLLRRAARERAPGADFLVVVPPLDRLPGETVLRPGDPFRGQAQLESFLSQLRAETQWVPVDLDALARVEGASRWRDERLWAMGRMRLNPLGCQALAGLVARVEAARRLPRAKAVVVDLDDTLWGGVVGEDGWERLVLGDEGLGLAFAEFQRELLRLRAGGLALAVCSKNDEATAFEAFARHPGMILKKEHFAAFSISWGDKADGIRAVAAALNVGEDALVFLDDDPVQRAAVSSRTKAFVPELPKDAAARPAFLRALAPLQRWSLTEEDRSRAAHYAVRAAAQSASAAASDLASFLVSLEQKARLRAVDAALLARAAQLCGKTNQFNLTTRRRGEAELSALLAGGRHELWTLALSDRFGDHGVVGLGILALDGASAEVDTLLLSCRVLGRKAEHVLLAQLCARAKARGAETLVGRYAPTPRNGQVKDLYPRLGFKPSGENAWMLDLAAPVAFPTEVALA